MGYAGAVLLLALALMTTSTAAGGLVEDGNQIVAASKSRISTSSANRMVRISKGAMAELSNQFMDVYGCLSSNQVDPFKVM